jgi:putative oxidoreductase
MRAKGSSWTANWGAVVLRLVVGLVFTAHGAQKFLNLRETARFFDTLGIPLPALAAVVVTAVELFGGLALLVGLRTRLAAVLLAVDMLVAILRVHIAAGFFAPEGIEFPLTLFGACLSLVLLGSGSLSLDEVFSRRPKETQTAR